MRFLIIIPAHNEEQYVSYCLASLESQTFRNYKIVVVNDGSSDKTQHIVETFVNNNDKFSLINLQPSEHQPGAKVVQTFYKGLEQQNLDDFDVICKFDADIIFPKNYLEQINNAYEKNPDVGMVSGIVKITKSSINTDFIYNFDNQNNDWIFENISSKNHIRGPIKSYKKSCLIAMNGLKATLGWDNIDVMLAEKYGYKTLTIRDLWVKHLRPTAYKYKNQKAEKLGEYFYNIGLSIPLMVISAIKSTIKSKNPYEFITIIKSFLKQNHKIALTKEEIQFIRNHRWKTMLRKIIG